MKKIILIPFFLLSLSACQLDSSLARCETVYYTESECSNAPNRVLRQQCEEEKKIHEKLCHAITYERI